MNILHQFQNVLRSCSNKSKEIRLWKYQQKISKLQSSKMCWFALVIVFYILVRNIHSMVFLNLVFMTSIMDQKITAQKYWRINLKYLSILLFIWFLCSFGLGVFFVDALNNFNIGGFPLGFWFAQQGSIYIFVVLIFTYVFLMNRLDKRFGFED